MSGESRKESELGGTQDVVLPVSVLYGRGTTCRAPFFLGDAGVTPVSQGGALSVRVLPSVVAVSGGRTDPNSSFIPLRTGLLCCAVCYGQSCRQLLSERWADAPALDAQQACDWWARVDPRPLSARRPAPTCPARPAARPGRAAPSRALRLLLVRGSFG